MSATPAVRARLREVEGFLARSTARYIQGIDAGRDPRRARAIAERARLRAELDILEAPERAAQEAWQEARDASNAAWRQGHEAQGRQALASIAAGDLAGARALLDGVPAYCGGSPVRDAWDALDAATPAPVPVATPAPPPAPVPAAVPPAPTGLVFAPVDGWDGFAARLPNGKEATVAPSRRRAGEWEARVQGHGEVGAIALRSRAAAEAAIREWVARL